MTLENAKCGKIIIKKGNLMSRLFNWKRQFKVKILFDFLTEEINTKYFKTDSLTFGEKKASSNIPTWITKKQNEIFSSVYHNNKFDYSLYLLKKMFSSSKYSDKINDSENIEIMAIYYRANTDQNEVISIIKLCDNNSKIIFSYDSKEFTESEIGVIIHKIFKNYDD